MTVLSLEDRTRITALLTEFDWRIDHGGDVGSLFSVQGALVAPGIGLQVRGCEAISAYFASRQSDTVAVTRHTWCSLHIGEVTGSVAKINTIQITYLRLAGEQPASKHLMVGDTWDVVERNQDGRWRFVERCLEVVFPFDVKPI